LWIGSTPRPSVSSVVAPKSTSDLGRPHRIIGAVSVDGDVGLCDRDHVPGAVGIVNRATVRRGDADSCEGLDRDLGEQRPRVDEPFEVESSPRLRRMADRESDGEGAPGRIQTINDGRHSVASVLALRSLVGRDRYR
jgi:hypothetical protein